MRKITNNIRQLAERISKTAPGKPGNLKFEICNLKFKNSSGSILIYNIILIFIFSLVMLGILSYATIQLRVIRGSVNNELAFQIAEAGANYYQWHLAHFAVDYQDGTGVAGPYVHDYIDKDTNQIIGRYSLTITPPSTGSTIVTVRSTGYTLANPNQKRVVTIRYGIPSLAQYAFLTNSDAWIGDTETVNGQFHSNGGVRFDGTGSAPIFSAKTTYNCQSWSGSPCPTSKSGIWGSAPTSTQAFWQFPVPNVDFSTMTADLATMKSNASSNGIYLAPSNAQGYSLVFNADGTVTIYKVTSLVNGEPTGWDVNSVAHNTSVDYSGRTQLDGDPLTAGVQNYTAPSNGIIYVEDKVWVEGIVKGRWMVAAAKLPYNANTAPNIYVPNNICYTVCGSGRDLTSSLGLIAQQDFLVTYQSPNNLEIDAAIIAQNGSTQRYYWPGDIKTAITIYGTIASYGTWTWSWVNGSNSVISGYTNTNTIYDSNLLYAPPPSFPLTSNGYQQISWSSN